MAGEKIDFGTFISDVEAKIKALQDVRSALINAQALGALGQVIEGLEASPLATNGETGIPTELPKGAFLGKSLPVCVKMHLTAVHKKQSLKEIAAALRSGGVESTSSNFENVVNGAMQRLKASGEVLRFKDGYGLAEWYHPSLRTSGTPPKKAPVKPKKRRPRSGQPKTAMTEETESPAPRNEKIETTAKGSNEKQIVEYFRKHPGRELSKADLVGELGMRSQTAAFLLGKLAHRHVLTKTDSGTYRMVTA